MDGSPLGLGLVVEDNPTEFSCRCRLPNLNFCQYQIRAVSLNVVLAKITHYTVIYQLLMLIHVANILVLGVQIIMMVLCVIYRRLRLTSSTLSSTPSLAGRAMRVFSVPSLGLGRWPRETEVCGWLCHIFPQNKVSAVVATSCNV